MKWLDNTLYRRSAERIASSLPVREGCFLITGAGGLIGSCLTDALILANEQGAGFRIYAIGRSKSRLAERFGDAPGLILMEQDVAKPFSLPCPPDYVIHAASNADPRSYAAFPMETMLTNVLGAKNVLDACKGAPARILLTSTFEVYGRLEQDRCREDDYGEIDYNRIRACYPESKRVAELLFRTAYSEYGMQTLIARLSSIYGPTMKETDNKAHAQFLRNALRGENIELKSSGEQRRTYCYVMDAVSGLLTILFSGKAGEAYNVANRNAVATIAEVAETAARLSGTRVIRKEASAEEKKGYSVPIHCVLDTEKLEALGWKGEYSLKRGMEETLAILRSGL